MKSLEEQGGEMLFETDSKQEELYRARVLAGILMSIQLALPGLFHLKNDGRAVVEMKKPEAPHEIVAHGTREAAGVVFKPRTKFSE